MAPKVRKTNKHLPPHVYIKHGAYYYVNKKKQWKRLGTTFSESMQAWTKIVNSNQYINTMNQLFDRYMTEVAPLKSKKSYKDNISQIKPLRIMFGDLTPEDVTPVDIYKFLDERSKKAKVGANREKALLSHVFSQAIRWGIVKDNPCRHVKRITEKPRDRYVTDEEYLSVKSVAPDLIKNIMDFAYLTGQRIGDILKIKLSDLTEEGIRIEQNKTKSKLIIQWTEELRDCVERVKKMPRSTIYSFTLFCNKRGLQLTYDGFATQWDKTIKKALGRGLINERFTFHDIRAKSSSDAKNRQEASALLGHTDIRITEKIYNRKHKKVMPIK